MIFVGICVAYVYLHGDILLLVRLLNVALDITTILATVLSDRLSFGKVLIFQDCQKVRVTRLLLSDHHDKDSLKRQW